MARKPAAKVQKVEAEDAAQNGFTEEQLEKLGEIEAKVDDIEAATMKKLSLIEEEKKKEQQPLFEKRDKILSSVPHFWAVVVKKSPLWAMLSDVEKEIFNDHLVGLSCHSTGSSNKITFKFSKNEYFTNNTLVHEISVNRELEDDDEDAAKVVPATIDWKKGKNLLEKGPDHKTGDKRKSGHMHADGEECDEDHDEDVGNFFEWITSDSYHDTSDVSDLIAEEIYPKAYQIYSEEDDNELDGEDEEEEEDEE